MYDKNIKFWLSSDQYQLLFVMSMRRQVSMSKILRKAVEALTDLQVEEWQEQKKKKPEKLTPEQLKAEREEWKKSENKDKLTDVFKVVKDTF